MALVAKRAGLRVSLDEGQVLVGARTKWMVLRFVAKGAFGTVYKVQRVNDTRNPPRKYAMKIELKDAKLHPRPSLPLDVQVLAAVSDEEGNSAPGFVDLFDSFHSVDSFGVEIYVMVMQLVGVSLASLRSKRSIDEKTGAQHLSPKCAITIAQGILRAMEKLHSTGYIHRDMKPGNWAIGSYPYHRNVYLLDLGMCRRFKGRKGERAKAPGRGTPFYAPRAYHERKEQGPLDDVEGWFYSFVELMIGDKLPWNDAKPHDEMYQLKRDLYIDQTPARIHLFRLAPKQFATILDIIDDRPHGMNTKVDYAKIHSVLELAIDKNGWRPQHRYDWETPVDFWHVFFPWFSRCFRKTPSEAADKEREQQQQQQEAKGKALPA